MPAVTIRRQRNPLTTTGYSWVVRVNGNKVGEYGTGPRAIAYVHREMTQWYIKDAQQQQFKDRMMAQMMGQATGQLTPPNRRAEIAAALAKRAK